MSPTQGKHTLPEQWKKLQNGSDIRGVAMEGVEGEKVNLSEHVVSQIAAAFGEWLQARLSSNFTDLRVAIGHDSRVTAAKLKSAAAVGLCAHGIQVFDVGLASTPAMFMSTVTTGFEYDGSIMLTASHLPFNRNGLKFFTKAGGLENKDIHDILSIAARREGETPESKWATVSVSFTPVDFMSIYANQLVTVIRNGSGGQERPLEGFKIIVDAGNGAGGFFVDKVLKPLGADTSGSQFLEPDGMFPNHMPNPEHKPAMEACREATLRAKADLGIIFDTDVDRAAVVDPKGNEINRDRLIALIAAIVSEEHPGTTIVTDSVTSNGLKDFIENHLKCKHHRFMRGYKNVINEAIRLNTQGEDTHLAIETSGHGAIKENYFLDDGAYLVVKILVQIARMKPKSIFTMIENLKEPVEDEEFRFKVNTPEFVEYGTKAIKHIEEVAKSTPGWELVKNNYEGVRVSVDKDHGDGWFLLRLSLHDPVLPLNIQSDKAGGVTKIGQAILDTLKDFDLLDFSALKKYLSK